MDKLKPLAACDQGPWRDHLRRILRMRRKLVIIGYEMNRAPVRVLPAPSRLRYEGELGFQIAK